MPRNSRKFRVMLVSGGKSRQVRELRRQMPCVVEVDVCGCVGKCRLWACTLCRVLLQNYHALLLPTAHSVHGGRPFVPDDPGLH